MTPGEEYVARARSCIGHGCVYRLGRGGMKSAQVFPWGGDPGNGCDCSGFVAWALGSPRYRPDLPGLRTYNGGWLETTAIAADAAGAHELFEQVTVESALPGDVVVYGDMGGKQGHIGLIATAKSGPGDPWLRLTVVHCSMGNYKTYGDAIRETGAVLWSKRGGIVARYRGLA